MTEQQIGQTWLLLAQEGTGAPVEGGAPISQVPGDPGATPQQPAIGPGGPLPGPGNQPPKSILGDPMFMMLGLVMVFFLFMMMNGRKERKRRATMLEALKKHDKVHTSAGIIGTVIEVKGEEVVLRVDEATDTRIRFSKQAVQSVLKEAPEPVKATANQAAS